MKDTPSASGMPSVGALLDLLTVADNPVDRPHTNTNTNTITNTNYKYKYKNHLHCAESLRVVVISRPTEGLIAI